MEYAIQRCCATSVFLKQYETSTNAILEKFNIGATDIKEFNCCGYPLKNINLNAQILSSARNLSIAYKRDLDIMTLCNCCFGSLKYAKNVIESSSTVRESINEILNKEGLEWKESTDVKHILEILYNEIGIDRIRENITNSLKGLKIAVHYGCHILRPKLDVKFQAPFISSMFDQLVELTGVEIVPWQNQMECCGAPLWGIDDDLSMDLTQKKLENAYKSKADYLCTACAFCQLQFDRVQKIIIEERNVDHKLPSILITQLLGLCMGIEPEKLGLEQNELKPVGINKILLN